MRTLFILAILLLSSAFAFAQNEQAPVVEKELAYKDWTYKNVRTDAQVNLRDFTAGKKLVLVVYFAPWCPNWRARGPVCAKNVREIQSRRF